jgi:hypothetical protein
MRARHVLFPAPSSHGGTLLVLVPFSFGAAQVRSFRFALPTTRQRHTRLDRRLGEPTDRVAQGSLVHVSW